jgi:Zn ribbon nucleic-acid-binding protein
MDKNCKQCGILFEVTDEDLAFYKKISPRYKEQRFEIPPPTLCPNCRQQRRITWRNERSLYNRECSKTGKTIISQYHKDVPFPVYESSLWWSDDWDGKDYAQEVDFNRPFFSQLMELRDKVPHFPLAAMSTTLENSSYTNHVGYLKNCYLVYNSDHSEQCMYSKGVNRCFDCLDCFKVYECEGCYECMNCYNCQQCSYVWDSYNSSDCHYSYNIIGSRNCFLSVNLQNAEYYFMNRKYAPEEYKKKLSQFKESHSPEQTLKMLEKLKYELPIKHMNEKNTENCTGDYLVNCKNCTSCFDSEYLENSKHCFDLKKGDAISYENYDIASFGLGVIQCYEGGTVGYNANHCLFTENVWEGSDVHYSMLCMNNCKDLFGCVGLKKAQYCIFNKQFESKEAYEQMVSKVVNHMQETGEWGEFFPTSMSPFAYNETMAQEYFPLSKEQVESKGWKWRDKETPKSDGDPDTIICTSTGRPFKLQAAEKEFYKKRDLPIPEYCPDERHLRRLKYRCARNLVSGNCSKCVKEFKTSSSNKSAEKLYCSPCYLQEAH